MTSGGGSGRKRRWDLDDKGGIEQKDNDIKSNSGGDTSEKVIVKEAKTSTVSDTSEIVDEKSAVESAKEAAERIALILLNQNTKKDSETEDKSSTPKEDKITVSEQERENIPVTSDSTITLSSKSSVKEDVDINDSRHRYHLIKPTTISDIERDTGAYISVRGKYFPDRALITPDTLPLTLHVVADTQAQLDAAIEMVNGIMANGPTIAIQNTLKVYAGFDADGTGINVRSKILGPQGSFLRHIQSETGVKATLRGRGSGHVEIGVPDESKEALHLLLQGERQVDLEYAKKLAEDLMGTVKSEVEAAKRSVSMPMNMGMPMPMPMGIGMMGQVPMYPGQYPGQYQPYQQYPQQQYPQYPQYPQQQQYPPTLQYRPYQQQPIPQQPIQQPIQQQEGYTSVPPPANLYSNSPTTEKK